MTPGAPSRRGGKEYDRSKQVGGSPARMEDTMRRGVWVAVFVAASVSGAFAQAAPDASFNDAQREGLRLFSQSCGVCHTVVQQRAKQYAPVLSRDTLGGDEELIREYIGNGTPRMPGFRYNFEPAQINDIVQYIKTISPAPAGAK
jgi:mono/diheme cytochrome c family protein